PTVTAVDPTSAHGAVLTLNTDGTISYDPTGADAVQALATGQTLIDTFTYTIEDGNGGEDTATVYVLVHGTNDAPVVVDDVAQSSTPITDDAVTFIETATLLANDSDVDGDALTVTAVEATSAQGATLTLNTDGTISYDPTGAAAIRDLAEGATLTDTFTYTVEDGNGGESTATVSIVVHGKNDAPLPPFLPLLPEFSAEDEAVSFTLPPDAFTDPNGDPLTLTATLADGTALPDWLAFDAVAESFSGTPPQDFYGILDIRVTASDGSLSTSETFTLEITPVNDAPVAADDSVGSSEFRVNQFTDEDQDVPSITTLANGNFVVTWQSEDRQQDDTSQTAIKARVFDANGDEIVSEFLVNEFTSNYQLTSSVTALANGHFVVTWQSLDKQQGDPSDWAINARVFDANGGEIVSEFLVNEFTNSWQVKPSVTALANGHFVITWESWGQQQDDTSQAAIKARIFDADGDEIVSEFLVNEFTNNDQRSPSVTALETGHFVVTWQSLDGQQGDPSGYAVKARIFDADGSEIVSEFLVNEFTNDSQWIPSVTTLANGNFVVTWSSGDGQPGDTEGTAVKARIFDADGNVIVNEFLVNEITDGNQNAPSVTALANGHFVVTWLSDDGRQGDTDGYAVKARIFDADGNEVVSEFLVNEFTNGNQGGRSETPLANQSAPSVTALANGHFVVTWQSLDGQQGDTSDYAIKARIFDANGVAQGPTSITEDAIALIDTATLLANDSDVEGDALTVIEVSAESAHGAILTLNTAGTISYDPTGAEAIQSLKNGEILTDTFTYTVSDGNGGESTATVSIVVHGRNEAPPIFGTAGDDALTGTPDDDILYGGAGNDSLEGLKGDDVLYGGAGDDVIYTSTSNHNAHDVGTDTARGGDGDDVITGSNGTDHLYGDAGNDTLNGGFDWITADVDYLYGGEGDDLLISGQGETRPDRQDYGDHLFGGAGNDTLESGQANDHLEGGAGNDTFVFDPGFGKDVVTDFVAGAGTDDVIEFRGVTNLASYADVLNNAADDGTDTTITLDTDNSIVLKNVVVSDLSSDDFRFFA
uniref:tandem-95 repeat protein n=1 Tax=uncultured Tateyamaria sp. TaxID=455651 RepID=UPI00261339C0